MSPARFIGLALALAACGGDDGACPKTARCAGRDAKLFLDAPLRPMPDGCITDVSSGDHTYTCGGLQVDARIPAHCQVPNCGLILELHGDGGTGLLLDAHLKLRDLGEQNGYIVVAPTGPPLPGGSGSTWNAANDATLVDIVEQFKTVFHVDPNRIHVTGFARGGFVTWRLLCDHSDLFASAAPAAAGFGDAFGEETCFQHGRAPATPIPFMLLMGRTDAVVGYQSMVDIRDAAVATYGVTLNNVDASDPSVTGREWTGTFSNLVIESVDHAYETYPTSAFASAKGHCIVGSTVDALAPQYALACQPPNAFAWGEAVMYFFMQHPP